jgi:hypothetical protein
MFTTSPSRRPQVRASFSPHKVDPAPGVPRSVLRVRDDAAALGSSTPLHRRVEAALASGDPEQLRACRHVPPADERDELLTMLSLQDLALAPLHHLGATVDFHGHPSAVELQHRLDHAYLDRLRRRSGELRLDLPDGVTGMRRTAAIDRVPAVYEWLRDGADWDQMVTFLTVEGGPDAGFDDLVSLAQVGIRGVPKVALGENYWDEMGRGRPERVHTELHQRLVDAIGMPRRPRDSLSTVALDRMALNGVLATHRWLQPELLGALGLIELQAGPRCRAVVGALERLGAGEDALDFYREHAEADPRHGKDWLDRVVAPLAEDPAWARRMVDGAVWRHVVNERFFQWWQRVD